MGVGGRGLSGFLAGKKAPFFRRTQRRDRPFPYIEHPTDNSRAVFRYFYPPGKGGQYGNGDYPPPDEIWAFSIEIQAKAKPSDVRA